jgi:hypothetical protein
MKNKLLGSLFAAAILIFVGGCTLPTGGGPGPRVWIDTPLDGDLLAFAPLVVKSHVSSEGGTTSAALLVNGVQVRVDTPTNPSDPLTSFAQVWEPTSPGDYGLEVVATDSDGNTGRSLVRVRISVEVYIPLCAAWMNSSRLSHSSLPMAPPSPRPSILPGPIQSPRATHPASQSASQSRMDQPISAALAGAPSRTTGIRPFAIGGCRTAHVITGGYWSTRGPTDLAPLPRCVASVSRPRRPQSQE